MSTTATYTNRARRAADRAAELGAMLDAALQRGALDAAARELVNIRELVESASDAAADSGTDTAYAHAGRAAETLRRAAELVERFASLPAADSSAELLSALGYELVSCPDSYALPAVVVGTRYSGPTVVGTFGNFIPDSVTLVTLVRTHGAGTELAALRYSLARLDSKPATVDNGETLNGAPAVWELPVCADCGARISQSSGAWIDSGARPFDVCSSAADYSHAPKRAAAAPESATVTHYAVTDFETLCDSLYELGTESEATTVESRIDCADCLAALAAAQRRRDSETAARAALSSLSELRELVESIDSADELTTAAELRTGALALLGAANAVQHYGADAPDAQRVELADCADGVAVRIRVRFGRESGAPLRVRRALAPVVSQLDELAVCDAHNVSAAELASVLRELAAALRLCADRLSECERCSSERFADCSGSARCPECDAPCPDCYAGELDSAALDARAAVRERFDFSDSGAVARCRVCRARVALFECSCDFAHECGGAWWHPGACDSDSDD